MAAPMKMTRKLFLPNMGITFRIKETSTLTKHMHICRRCLGLQRHTLLKNHLSIKGLNVRIYTPASRWSNEIYRGGNYSSLTNHPLQEKSDLYSLSNVSFKISKCLSVRNKSTRSENGAGINRLSGLGNSEVRENIMTIPNLLTMSRIVMTPVIGYLVMQESYPIALTLFAVAGFTDLLDGYIARNFKNQMSALGTALDPLADKILITVLTLTLTVSHLLPAPLTALIIGRDVALIATGFFIRYISLPSPRTFKRYFDVTNPTAKLMPSTLSKLNTGLQLGLVCATIAAPVFGYVDHLALRCLWILTATTTFGSGIDYIINRRKYVQYLNDGKEETK